MNTSRAFKYVGSKFVPCLLAGLCVMAMWKAAASSLLTQREVRIGHSAPPQPPPQAVPGDPKDLSPVFFEKAPSSVAELRIIEHHIEALVRQVSPAVVALDVGYGTGSGVVISSNGFVLTAGHVCERPDRKVMVTFPNGKTAGGHSLGVNENDDTGLVKIDDPGPWPCVPVGDLSHARLGDWTLALGNPGGFDSKRSFVARLGRIVRLAPDIVQTDCTLSPGDSGGPLFDMYGRVIGIHTAIGEELTENFHIPIYEYLDDWSELVAGDVVKETPDSETFAYCGATVEDDPQGCRLAEVAEDSPAERAGLRQGDIVLSIDNRDVKVAAMFERWIEESAPGDTLKMKIKRGSEVITASVKLGHQPKDE